MSDQWITLDHLTFDILQAVDQDWRFAVCHDERQGCSSLDVCSSVRRLRPPWQPRGPGRRHSRDADADERQGWPGLHLGTVYPSEEPSVLYAGSVRDGMEGWNL